MSKPRPPKVNKEALASFKANTGEIDQLKARLVQLEDLRKDEKLPPTYIAFEALSSLLGGRIEGFSDSDLRKAWPEGWGDSTVEVPATLLKVLAAAWVDYKGASSGVTLGEAFGVEGGGQGQAKLKDRQATRDRNRRLANEVAILYVAAGIPGENGEDPQPMPLEDACALVAENNGDGIDKVRKAYAEYNPASLKALKEKGILKG